MSPLREAVGALEACLQSPPCSMMRGAWHGMCLNGELRALGVRVVRVRVERRRGTGTTLEGIHMVTRPPDDEIDRRDATVVREQGPDPRLDTTPPYIPASAPVHAESER